MQGLLESWRRQGYALGFGTGIAMGFATVGRIGYEGRLDYTAIGSVVNLASRLCASAEDGQILIDPAAAAEIGHAVRCHAPEKAPANQQIYPYENWNDGDARQAHAIPRLLRGRVEKPRRRAVQP